MSVLNTLLISGLLASTAAAPAFADTAVRIEGAAARVVVIAENRGDYAVSINQSRAGLKPVTIRKEGGVTVVDGGYGARPFGFHWGMNDLNCRGSLKNNNVRVTIPGRGEVSLADLPVITIHAPMNAHVGASGAVYGEVNGTRGLDLANSGCGDWRFGDVQGPLHLALSGSGDMRGGAAGDTYIAISGSSDVVLGPVNGRLETHTSGSGDIHTASARGPIASKIAGSGDVTIDGGESPDVHVSIAGSGDFRFHGTAGTASIAVAGSGDVDLARVTGPVSKHVAGSGDVHIGH